MQVMTGAEFKQTQVVIGQQTKTRGFSVSDDPMLMSVLSTGLYQDPLKSMIQEVLFNAWDAHKAAGTTDKPVEITFTDDNQLIISDSGLGIAPEDMYEIYCVYGASTKRDDNDQTGGFGLGCKAPFAYTDSFRVTSSHGGKRYIYFVSRANDENDGKPGITELVGGLDSTESGLMVSIPLKDDRDANKAYAILKNRIFPYSGIKWTLNFKDHEQEEGQELSLAPGKFVLEPGQLTTHYGLTAQYGGVAYSVPYSDEYKDEYDYLVNLIGNVGSVRIGFAPGTLTPLPNREGLNLSERTVDNLRTQIGVITEKLNQFLHPIMELAINWVAYCLGEKDEHLYCNEGNKLHRTPFENFFDCGFNIDFANVLTTEQVRMFIDQPIEDEENHELIESFRSVIMSNTQKLIHGVGVDWFTQKRAIAWSVHNGHNRYAFDLLKDSYAYRHENRTTIRAYFNKKTIEKTIRNLIKVSKLVDIKPHLRIHCGYKNRSSRYTYVAQENLPFPYSAKQIYKKKLKDGTHVPTTRIKLNELRDVQGKHSAPQSLDPNNIILAHTIKDGNFYIPPAEIINHYPYRSIPIFVVGTSVKKMEAAKAFLEEQGYTVHEAPKYVEPIQEEIKSSTPKPVFKGWPCLDHYGTGFASDNTFYTNPTMYIQYSKAQQSMESYRDRFNSKAVRAINEYFSQEKIVVVNHPNKLSAVKQTGAVSVADRIDEIVRKVLLDTQFTHKLAIHRFVRHHENLPNGLLQIPEFSKLLEFPSITTQELVKFNKMMRLFDIIKYSKSHVFCSSDTRTLLDKNINTPDTTLFSRCKSILNALEVFNGRILYNRISLMSEQERKVYFKKLARFIRATAI